MARSSYFRAMLSSGMREDTQSEVDLSSEVNADEASLSVVLRFITCDAWIGPSEDMNLVFRVRALAERYQLQKLVCLAEARLQEHLSLATALKFLSQVAGSGTQLESACWDLLESDGASVIESSKHDLSVIIRQNPQLAQELIIRGF